MRDCTDVCFVGNLTIATSKECLIREVESIRQQAEQTLEQVDNLKMIMEKCKTLLADLNPAEKERAAMETWKRGIESDMHDLKDMVSTLVHELKGGGHE